TPYVAPKSYFDLYPVKDVVVPKVPSGYLDTLPAPARKSITRKKDQVNLKDKLAREAIQAYHASITFAYAQVGLILDALDELKLRDDTVVVFTSDHGYHMGEHGHWQKTTLFDNAARVPLIISAPGRASGARTKCLAEMTDLYPTLAELCGLKAPSGLSGVSLVPALKDAAATPRTAALTQYGTGYSIRTARYRYTEWGKDGADGNELYDHQADSAELVNLARRKNSQETIQELSALLKRRVAAAGKPPQGLKQLPAKR
ncbi:MAG: sulfatase-like hydrolase/transferase, partial [Planctomycetales bacterium]